MSRDPESLCLALRYVVYQDGTTDQSIGFERDALESLRAINAIWRDCGIGFQIEAFQVVVPDRFRLRYRTANYSELNQIRRAFQDKTRLLVVTTGNWDRRGSLGNSWANAWTNLPGEGIYGVIMEQSVATSPNIAAHELGHYLDLDHQSKRSMLMSPVIHDFSRKLSRQECEHARWAARKYWSKMLR